MTDNKHYGRQIVLSLFLTVFILVLAVFLSARYLLPIYDVKQDQIYGVLVKLFPLLIGLVMIEIGVIIARRRDEDYTDEIDKLPPNAYDSPLYVLPGDDPDYVSADRMAYAQPTVTVRQPLSEAPGKSEPVIVSEGSSAPAFSQAAASVSAVKPSSVATEEQPSLPTYRNDFPSIFGLELQNAIDMDYDLTFVLADIVSGPHDEIAERISVQSGDFAYSFILDDGKVALIMPFYNSDEARTFMLGLLDNCKKEFAGAELQIGFASRNDRLVDAEQLHHEAEVACASDTFEEDVPAEPASDED